MPDNTLRGAALSVMATLAVAVAASACLIVFGDTTGAVLAAEMAVETALAQPDLLRE
jgi:hypothetical protein